MNTGGGGIRRLTPLLLASLLLHLAVVVAVIGVFRRESAERQPPRMVVDYLEPRKKTAVQPERPAPRPAPQASPSPPESKARRVAPATPGIGVPQKPKQGTPPGAGQELKHAETASPHPGPGTPERPAARQGPSLPASASPPGEMVIITGTGGGGAGGAASQGGRSTGIGSGMGTGRGGAGGAREARGSGTLTTGSALRRSAYEALLKRLIEEHKEYPLAARRSRQEGRCLRRFVLDRSGTLKRVEKLSSCGHAFLDDAATRAITSVGTFPPPPDDYKGGEAAFIVPIAFSIDKK